MKPKPLYIFDLDGTLALIEHRRHHVEGATKDWPAFFAACVDDKPNYPVILTLQELQNRGNEIWIWSGRSDIVRGKTEHWLVKHGVIDGRTRRLNEQLTDRFRMRPASDHRPDEQLKAEWLAQMQPRDRRRLVAIFEDRDRMVAMWRSHGIACFQVAPGAF